MPKPVPVTATSATRRRPRNTPTSRTAAEVITLALEDILVDDGFNTRQDFGDLEDLANSIQEEGIRNPLTVWRDKDGKFHLSNGERRLRALRLLQDGRGVPGIPIPTLVEPEGERTLGLLIHNSGKPLNLLEQGRTMERLLAEHYNLEEIARSAGCSPTHVANCLALTQDAAGAVQEAVAAGVLSGTLAVDLVRAVPVPEQQEILLTRALRKANRAGSDRVTAKHIEIPVGKERQAGTPDGPRGPGRPVGSKNTVAADKLRLMEFRKALSTITGRHARADRFKTARFVLDCALGKHGKDDLVKYIMGS